MSYVGDGSGECENEGCIEFRFDRDAALREGWEVIDGGLFCPLHRAEKARAMLKFEEEQRARAQIAELRRARNELRAKQGLSSSEYRKWNEFQADLADFHKNTGKLAPQALRTLDHYHWLKIFTTHGRIDIEAEAEALQEAENRANETRKWMLGRRDG